MLVSMALAARTCIRMNYSGSLRCVVDAALTEEPQNCDPAGSAQGHAAAAGSGGGALVIWSAVVGGRPARSVRGASFEEWACRYLRGARQMRLREATSSQRPMSTRPGNCLPALGQLPTGRCGLDP